MSFILDALKKLEHKRQRSSAPSLLTIYDFASEKPKKHSVWLYLLIAVLLLNAGMLIIWLRPWQSEKQVTVKQSADIQKHESMTTESGKEVSDADVHVPDSSLSPGIAKTEIKKLKAASSVKQALAVPQNQPQAQPKTDRTVSDKPTILSNMEKSREITPTAHGNTPAINHQSNESPIYVRTRDSSEQRILEKNELPLSVQQELPNISIRGHIYSNDLTSRIVNINGQIIREGETVTAGLKLEEITEYGVILSYKGYRFTIRAFYNR
ncbi:MAG TPA: general secretion pathway protein GspB [Thermodesulfovibrionia bacterium]|nr:general secretion pathway protein GspB [Thermodesulfovibrionia bacterium]